MSEIVENRKTDTTIFLVPILGIPREKLDMYGFINGYLDDSYNIRHYLNSVYLLFKPADMEAFETFLEEEKVRYKDILDDYDYCNGYIVVVYRIPKEFLDDLSLILEGKYSKTSPEFKKKFPQIKKILDEKGKYIDIPTLQWMIFQKSDLIREEWERELDVEMEEGTEVWGKPDVSKEILDIEEIKKKEETNVQ